jgi:hypothetical protein
MSDVNVGLGIGLSGKLDATARIFAADQQEEQYKRKVAQAKQDAEDAGAQAVKKMILQDRNKYHRLFTKDVNDKTTKAMLDMAKAQAENPTNYLSDVYEIYGGLKQELDIAMTRTEQLKQFEKLTEEEKKGMFISPSQKKAYELMRNSSDYDSWINGLTKQGISDNYFAVDPETKEIGFKFQPAFDPVKFSQEVYKQRKDTPLSEKKKSMKVGESNFEIITTSYGLPRTKEQAQQIREDEIIARGGSAIGVAPAYSGEDVAELYLSDPQRLEQYVNRYPETANMSDADLTEHFLKNFYDPYTPFKEDPKTFKEGKLVNNFTVMGPDQPGRAFVYEKKKDQVPGTQIKYEGISYLNQNVQSKTAKTFLLSGAIETNGKSFEPKSNVGKATDYGFGNIYMVKTKTGQGNKKTFAGESETGAGIAYEPMVEVTFSRLDIGDKTVDAITQKTILMPLEQVKQILNTQKMTDKERASYNQALKDMKEHSNQLKSQGKKVK